MLPAISLGFWHNFGTAESAGAARAMARKAFDLGIVHFDLANNYGPPPGAAERTLGRLLAEDFAAHRDELFISTKAGYTMWPGPYGDHGSRKYLLASLDASLGRLGLDYVDLFYSHRPDFDTPLEETVEALAQAVRSGKALYVGLSNYPADRTREAARLLRGLGVPCLVHQPKYHMFERWIERGLLGACEGEGIGIAAFMPLAQGLLTARYLQGIPPDSRAAGPSPFLGAEAVSEEAVGKARALNEIAKRRGQSLAQMALAWTLRDPRVTTAIIGASRPEQVEENARALEGAPLSAGELAEIEAILGG
jgi:L-glyceraldehyde 3-phosphate reductase